MCNIIGYLINCYGSSVMHGISFKQLRKSYDVMFLWGIKFEKLKIYHKRKNIFF